MMASEKLLPGSGVPANSSGPAYDPSKNVLDLVEAERRRQDDLREAERRYFDAENAHVKEMAALRGDYQHKLDVAESARLDSIRQVDREDVNKTAAQALQAIQTLANVTNTTAETLRNQRSADTTEFNKRLSAVELALSEGKGKQTVADPMMAEMVLELKALRSVTSEARGVDPFISRGMEDMRADIKKLAETFAAGNRRSR